MQEINNMGYTYLSKSIKHLKDIKTMQDQIFKNENYPQKFHFDSKVTQVFDDMLSRSIPLYKDLVQFVTCEAIKAYQPNSYLLDLGCSTGLVLKQILHQTQNFKVKAFDNSPSMIHKAQENLKPYASHHQLEFLCEDITRSHLATSSVIIMSYTLQFIAIKKRIELLTKIYNALAPKGIFILSEKTYHADPFFQATDQSHYDHFKKQNGYSLEEIERKKRALEGVLIPMGEDHILDMLKTAGFQHIYSPYKWHSFQTFFAYKEE
jgi:tRNA (cmo5U34)-methyltransferase